jgi:hypothetical protein
MEPKQAEVFDRLFHRGDDRALAPAVRALRAPRRDSLVQRVQDAREEGQGPQPSPRQADDQRCACGRRPRRVTPQREGRGAEAVRGDASIHHHARGRSRAGGGARGGEYQVRRASGEHMALRPSVLGLACRGVRRRLGVPHAPLQPPAGAHGHRQEQGQGVRRARNWGDVRRCRRHRRGPRRVDGDRGLPQEPRPLPAPRREDSQRSAHRRRARNRQDAAGQGRRRPGGRAVLQPERLGLRGDVRRGRRRPRSRPLRPGPGEGSEHHLHRRARCLGEGTRHQPDRGRPRRARADPESAPCGAGRLRHSDSTAPT